MDLLNEIEQLRMSAAHQTGSETPWDGFHDLWPRKLVIISVGEEIGNLRVAMNHFDKLKMYYAFEIDEDCVEATKKQWDDHVHMGDIRKSSMQQVVEILVEHKPDTVLLSGHFKCEDILKLKKQKAEDGTESSLLFYHFVRFLHWLDQGCRTQGVQLLTLLGAEDSDVGARSEVEQYIGIPLTRVDAAQYVWHHGPGVWAFNWSFFPAKGETWTNTGNNLYEIHVPVNRQSLNPLCSVFKGIFKSTKLTATGTAQFPLWKIQANRHP